MNQCTKCKQFKDLEEFNKNQNWCKLCKKEYGEQYRIKNKEKIKKYHKEYRKKNKTKLIDYSYEYYRKNKKRENERGVKYYNENKEKVLKRCREYRERNKDKIKKYDKYRREKRIEYGRKYRETHKEQFRQYNIDRREEHKQYERNLRKKPKYKLNQAVSASIRHSFKTNKDNQHWEKLLPYSLNKLMRHLEKQFTPKMNWNNYGTYWHLEHVIPISAFNFDNYKQLDFKKCWALENLRPLEKHENLVKHNKINGSFQPSLKL